MDKPRLKLFLNFNPDFSSSGGWLEKNPPTILGPCWEDYQVRHGFGNAFDLLFTVDYCRQLRNKKFPMDWFQDPNPGYKACFYISTDLQDNISNTSKLLAESNAIEIYCKKASTSQLLKNDYPTVQSPRIPGTIDDFRPKTLTKTCQWWTVRSCY